MQKAIFHYPSVKGCRAAQGYRGTFKERVCENSFRSSAEIVSEEMADHISYGTVWNVPQKMGEKKLEEIKAKAALAEQKKGTG